MSGVIANNFGSLPVVFDHGEGARLFDTEGKEYIDFSSGIGVNSLGFCGPADSPGTGTEHSDPYRTRGPAPNPYLRIFRGTHSAVHRNNCFINCPRVLVK